MFHDVNNWTLSIEYYYIYSKEVDTRDTRGTILYILHMVWQKKKCHTPQHYQYKGVRTPT